MSKVNVKKKKSFDCPKTAVARLPPPLLVSSPSRSGSYPSRFRPLTAVVVPATSVPGVGLPPSSLLPPASDPDWGGMFLAGARPLGPQRVHKLYGHLKAVRAHLLPFLSNVENMLFTYFLIYGAAF
jgi:hypothetical protein